MVVIASYVYIIFSLKPASERTDSELFCIDQESQPGEEWGTEMVHNKDSVLSMQKKTK